MKRLFLITLTALLLTSCGEASSEESSMRYIKRTVTYDTLSDMYQNPDNYLGDSFHIVGTLYPYYDDDGELFYSVYAEDEHGDEGIGLELDWDNFEGFADYDTVTVEGKLEKTTYTHEGAEQEYLILRVTSLEKRES